MISGALSVSGVARGVGMLLVNTIGAVVGVTIVEEPLKLMIPTHSPAAVVGKEWVFSIVCAALLGFLGSRTWLGATTQRTWILTSILFGLGVLVHSNHPSSGASIGNLWSLFSGTDCAVGLNRFDCVKFFVFTVPFIRGLSYSSGALLSSWTWRLGEEKANSDKT